MKAMFIFHSFHSRAIASWILCVFLSTGGCSSNQKSSGGIQGQGGMEDIRIGYFGPDDPFHPVGGGMWQAAVMAIEEANRKGGYNGRPFRLISCWADDPWAAGVNAVSRAVFVDRVCAVIGGIDGPTTHLAEQIVVKAQLAMINPSSTDKTINLAFVPWMFSCLPDDERQAGILAAHIHRRLGGSGDFVVVSSDDHDSHLFSVELLKALGSFRRNPRHHFQFHRDEQNLPSIAHQVRAYPDDAVLLIAGAETSGRMLCALRDSGFRGTVFGGPWMGQERFITTAGNGSEEVIFPLLWNPTPTSERFIRDFRERTRFDPDYLAAQTYDAIHVLVEAIRRSGPERPAIIDSVKNQSPWPGVAGSIQWDRLGRNQRPVRLGTIRNGRIQPFNEPSEETMEPGLSLR